VAHKKGTGSSRNGRDSNAQMRGIKVYGGQLCPAGGIIVRQVGTRFHPGLNVGMGKDFTIYSLIEGTVKFKTHRRGSKTYKRVHVEPRAVSGAPSNN
jgi:large subunit ribosomal protein L27